MHDELPKLIELAFQPPGIALLFMLLGILFIRLFPKFAFRMVLISFLLLWALSMPVVSFTLLDYLQNQHQAMTELPEGTDSIVVLGAGRYESGAEFNSVEMLSGSTLERIRYAGRLAKQYNLPVIVSGGQLWGHKLPESTLGRRYLESELDVREVIEESQSKTTLENAINTQEILKSRQLNQPLLVTHYWHMPRAIETFQHFGMKPHAAPTARYTDNTQRPKYWRWLPQAVNLYYTSLGLHEIAGLLWYRFSDFGAQRAIPPDPAEDVTTGN